MDPLIASQHMVLTDWLLRYLKLVLVSQKDQGSAQLEANLKIDSIRDSTIVYLTWRP